MAEKISLEASIAMEEVRLGEKVRPIKLGPVCDMYVNGDPNLFLTSVMDYVWFDDLSIHQSNYSNLGGYDYFLEKRNR